MSEAALAEAVTTAADALNRAVAAATAAGLDVVIELVPRHEMGRAVPRPVALCRVSRILAEAGAAPR